MTPPMKLYNWGWGWGKPSVSKCSSMKRAPNQAHGESELSPGIMRPHCVKSPHGSRGSERTCTMQHMLSHTVTPHRVKAAFILGY